MASTTARPSAVPTRTRWRLGPGVPVLLVSAGFAGLVLLLAVIGLGVDGRTITGAPAWLKPLKFAVSISVYCATLAWMLGLVRGHSRLVRLISWVTGLALALELVLISVQVVRGTTSHFNLAETFDALLFEAMGGLITLVFVAAIVTAVLLARQRGLPPVLAAGIRGGSASPSSAWRPQS